MGAASSSVLGSLLAPSANLSASEREARDNLVTSLVAGIAAVSGQDVATATGAGRIEVENNQVAPMAPVPGWLAGFKLPGYKGETASKDNGVIADPATELDPTIKVGMPGSELAGSNVIDRIFDAPTVDVVKGLVEYLINSIGGKNSSVPPSIKGSDGNLPAGIGGVGTPIPMPPSSNPNETAEQFAKDAFNGQTPVKVVNNVTGEGSWVAILPDGTAVTYRPAGQASSKTAGDTATVEVNNSAVKAINRGEIAKFKFPGK
ncbi:hypothetical protein [Burkholderia ubonensis]|uniref:hypothetical protein n=1 Tax=Burkholderia ubonensis TaxID=101571 RepID=UPI00187F67E0|nr:hypothetical protein [Burkholderia ubonensis]